MSIIPDEVVVDGRFTNHRRHRGATVLVAVLAFAAAAFCWSFALPLIGLAVFVSKFFAG